MVNPKRTCVKVEVVSGNWQVSAACIGHTSKGVAWLASGVDAYNSQPVSSWKTSPTMTRATCVLISTNRSGEYSLPNAVHAAQLSLALKMAHYYAQQPHGERHQELAVLVNLGAI